MVGRTVSGIRFIAHFRTLTSFTPEVISGGFSYDFFLQDSPSINILVALRTRQFWSIHAYWVRFRREPFIFGRPSVVAWLLSNAHILRQKSKSMLWTRSMHVVAGFLCKLRSVSHLQTFCCARPLRKFCVSSSMLGVFNDRLLNCRVFFRFVRYSCVLWGRFGGVIKNSLDWVACHHHRCSFFGSFILRYHGITNIFYSLLRCLFSHCILVTDQRCAFGNLISPRPLRLGGIRICVAIPQYEVFGEVLQSWGRAVPRGSHLLASVNFRPCIGTGIRTNWSLFVGCRARRGFWRFKDSPAHLLASIREAYWAEYLEVKKVRLVLPFWVYTVAAISELARFGTARSSVVASTRRRFDTYWYAGWFLREWFKVSMAADIVNDWGLTLRGQRAGAPGVGCAFGSVYYGSFAGLSGFGSQSYLDKRRCLIRLSNLNMPNNFCVNVSSTSGYRLAPYKWASRVSDWASINLGTSRFVCSGLFVRRFLGWSCGFIAVDSRKLRFIVGQDLLFSVVGVGLCSVLLIQVSHRLLAFCFAQMRTTFSGVGGGVGGRVVLQNSFSSVQFASGGLSNSLAQDFFE